MQIEKGYAELYAWIIHKVLSVRSDFVGMSEIVSSINETVPGVHLELTAFKFGNLIIPFENFPSLSRKEIDDLERYMLAQSADILFPDKDILSVDYVRKHITFLQQMSASVSRRRTELYGAVCLYLNRCLQSPESFLY